MFPTKSFSRFISSINRPSEEYMQFHVFPRQARRRFSLYFRQPELCCGEFREQDFTLTQYVFAAYKRLGNGDERWPTEATPRSSMAGPCYDWPIFVTADIHRARHGAGHFERQKELLLASLKQDVILSGLHSWSHARIILQQFINTELRPWERTWELGQRAGSDFWSMAAWLWM